MAPGNLLVKNGSLCGVIDFGIMGIGDPACDYAMAWTFFDEKSRKYFCKVWIKILLTEQEDGHCGRHRLPAPTQTRMSLKMQNIHSMKLSLNLIKNYKGENDGIYIKEKYQKFKN